MKKKQTQISMVIYVRMSEPGHLNNYAVEKSSILLQPMLQHAELTSVISLMYSTMTCHVFAKITFTVLAVLVAQEKQGLQFHLWDQTICNI